MADSTTTIVGNLTADSELRYTPGGSPVANFGVAVNRRWQKDGEWQEETSFLDVVCYGTLAENVAGSLQKGDRVLVTGRVQQRSWEAQDGTKRSKVEVVADEVGPSLRWATVPSVNRQAAQSQNGARQPSTRSAGARPRRPASHEEDPF